MSNIEFTEEEKAFIGSLKALMVRHNVSLEFDSPFLPLFSSKNGTREVNLTIVDIYDFIKKES